MVYTTWPGITNEGDRRSIVQSQNLRLNLNTKAHVWDWTMEHCLPNNALTIIQYIQSYSHTLHTLHALHTIVYYTHYIRSYVTHIAYNHTLHTLYTLHTIIHYIYYIKSLQRIIHYTQMQIIQYISIFHTNHTLV